MAAPGMKEGQPVPLEETAGPPAEELAAQVGKAVQQRLAHLAALAPVVSSPPSVTSR